MPAPRNIRFDDGAAYERMMGTWSRIAGAVFLDWLAPLSGLRWIDVGCGNGAFTELLVERCAPAGIMGIDPSEGQLSFARTRPAARIAEFHHGDAMAIPVPEARFDAAVMALVIFFVPDPARGVAEMVRVVKPGGTIAAYAWDVLGGGYPMEPIQAEMRAMGMTPLRPPRMEVAQIDALRSLWAQSGIVDVETRQIAVTRSFADFEDFWATTLLGAGLAGMIAEMPPGDAAVLKDRVRARLPPDEAGCIVGTARANAVKGRVPS